MKGINDYLPGDMRQREYVIGQIKSTYGSYGFCPIPPAEEFAENVCDEFFSLPLFPLMSLCNEGSVSPTNTRCTNSCRRNT